MENPNDYVSLQVAKSYMADREKFEKSRLMLKNLDRKKPGRVYCAVCVSLVTIGRMFVAFGRRLERYDIGLQQANIKS